jgi:L-fuculose-phosphate aldolase
MNRRTPNGERNLRQALAKVGKRLYDAGLIAAADGNISVRLDQQHLLVTPSGVAKGAIGPNDMVVVDHLGRVVGTGTATSELGVHLCIYRNRPDVGSVVESHTRWYVAASFQRGLRFDFAPEAVVALGGVHQAEYARPGSSAVFEGIEQAASSHNSFILTRHGAVTAGKDLTEATMRMEALEHSSKIALLALIGGELTPLPQFELDALREGATDNDDRTGGEDAIRGASEVAISAEEALVRALARGGTGDG